MDVRSIRKTWAALTSPSCFLLFDGLRVEFATTAAPSSIAGGLATSSLPPPPRAAVAPSKAAVGASTGAATRGAAAPERQGSSLASTDSAVNPGRHGHEEGAPASMKCGDRVVNGGGGGDGLMPPPFLSPVETVRVLSVEAAERDSSNAS